MNSTRIRAVSRHYPLLLLAFTLLFLARVLGQVLVAFFHISFLPPMEHWYSGLLPYPVLLPIQILFIIIMAKIVFDFYRRTGYFVIPRPRTGMFMKWFSYLYFLSMVVRYIVTMWLHPELRWFTDTIPIWFHMVLAAFLYTFSHYHIHSVQSQPT